MLYRRFGRTELQIPVFSTGGMRYQHDWKDLPYEEVPQEAQDKLENTIRRSMEVGINHIETARGYGTSEVQLARILPKFPREELIVQTKVGPLEDTAEFRRQVIDSIDRLKVGYIDLFGIHGINNGQTLEWAVRKGGCLEAARELQKEGLIRHIGFSTHGDCEIIREAINTEVYGGFDYVNIHWYYIYQHNHPAIEAAHKKDMGVFIISPSDKGGMLYKAPEKLHELTKPLHPLVFNDLFCLDNPKVHTLSLGAAKPSDYDLHLEALELYEKRGELLPPILGRLKNAMIEEVGYDFITDYAKGIPEWWNVPGEINARIIRWLYNLRRTFDLQEYAEMRYGLLGNADHWFPGQNASKIDELDWPEELGEGLKETLREAHQTLFKKEVKRLSESEKED